MSIIAEVNAVELDPDLFHGAIEALMEVAPEGAGDVDTRLREVAMFLRSHGITGEDGALLAMAIHLRLSALYQLLKSGGGKGFTTQSSEAGRFYLNEAVVRCAAEEPLLDQEGPVSFDPASFHQRLLSLGRSAGRA